MKSVSIAAIAGAAMCSLGQADVRSINDAVFGNGAITRDVDQNLDFLDFSFTRGLSYNDVAGQFGAGGDFAGFRFATTAEFVTLSNNFGLRQTNGQTLDPDGVLFQFFDMEDLTDFKTLVGFNSPFSFGTYLFADLGGFGVRGGSLLTQESGPDQFTFNFSTNLARRSSSVAPLLVRNAPAPGTVASLAMVGLFAVRRRR